MGRVGYWGFMDEPVRCISGIGTTGRRPSEKSDWKISSIMAFLQASGIHSYSVGVGSNKYGNLVRIWTINGDGGSVRLYEPLVT